MDTSSPGRTGLARVAPVAACLFGSGLCALVYQTAWLREFRLIFGASTAASAAVLAIFMAGVGAGSVVLGRKADALANPLRRYALLELGIAATAALTPPLLWCAGRAYVALGGTPALGATAGAGLRLVLASLVLLAPTFLMGGTLPAAVRAAQGDGDVRRRSTAALYGVNTCGAVAGALLATFLLFEALGNRLTLWTACGVNVVVALAALFLSRRTADGDARAAEAAPAAPPAAVDVDVDIDVSEPAAPAGFVLGAAAVAGFAFFLMELVWYRMLGPLLGGSTFTFGLILAVALVGIAVGSLAFATFRSGRAVSLPGFAAVCALEALCIALPYAIGDRLVTLTAMLQPVGSLSFLARVVEWTVVAGIVAGPASVLAGVQFPMLIALLGRGRRDVGSHTGLTYAWNTVGAIVGSLAGGFGLLPALGAPGAWKLVVTLLVTLSACALLIAARSRLHWTRLLPGAAVGAAAVALLSAVGPTAAWRHSPVGAGRVQMTASSVNDIREYARSRRHSLRWEAEGVESSVGVLADDGYAFVVNGKVDGNARGDAPTQVMLGLLGALIHGAPRDALVVGLGTGSSAGWLADVPTIERVDVVELEPAIRTVAEFCAPVNRNALANPKVHVWYGDAREAMLAGEGQFDLIASEPSNPYRAGVASLFTREFYEAAGRRLRPKGIFVQWVQAYEVDGESIRSLYATLSSVFPAVESWRTEAGDLLFVAAREPIVHDVTALRARLREEPYRSGMAWVWRVTDAEGVFGHYVGNRHLATAAVDPAAALNTDDRNGLEFAFARTVGREAGFDVEVLARAAQARQFDEPEVVHGTLDWDKVCDRRLSAWVLDGQTDFELSAGDDASRARAAAKSAYAKGDLAAARAAWFRQSEEPADLLELTLVAQSLAGTADDRAPKYAEQLAAWLPHEAEAVMAQYVWLKGRPLEALQLAERALVGYRTDPWPRPIVMRTTLAIARSIAEQDGCPPAAVAGLFEVLREPFAVALLDKERMQARLALAQVLDRAGPTRLACDVLSEFEPHTPWSLDFLRLRAATYARAGDPRTAEAQADLDAFESAEARPFVLRAADAATDAATDDGANRTGALPEPGAEPRVAQAQGK